MTHTDGPDARFEPRGEAPRRRRASRGSGEQLHAEIMIAAKALLAEAGSSDSVSIRKVAQRVGVTPPAIYLHFADKDALIAAVVVDVFSELNDTMVAAARDTADPLDRLCAYGRAFVRFAVRHPEHYRIATMEPRNRIDGERIKDVDRQLADSAFSLVRAAVNDCMTVGGFSRTDDVPLTLELWSVLHGIAALMVTKPDIPWGDKGAFVDRALRATALGHAVIGVLGDDVGLTAALARLIGPPC